MIYRFCAIPIKILASIFIDIRELILHFIRKGKGTRTAKTLKSPWADRQEHRQRERWVTVQHG